MKVQLIHPPVYLNVHAMTALRPSMPLGLAYIAAALRREGHRISVLDAVADAPEQVTKDGKLYRLGLTTEAIVARLDPAAEAFAVTNMWSFSWPLVREILHAIRAAKPAVPIICGGEHFTGLPELSLRTAPIDYIVLGEGEETAVELFAALDRQRCGEPVAFESIAGIRGRHARRQRRGDDPDRFGKLHRGHSARLPGHLPRWIRRGRRRFDRRTARGRLRVTGRARSRAIGGTGAAGEALRSVPSTPWPEA
jgi:radical SAM superfamily enzyme YgiQ (UPF0313 family)